MKRKLLVSSIMMGLAVTFSGNLVFAQSADQSSQDQTDQKKKVDELATIPVTGSLIPRAQVETASPVITITGADIQREGFRNVYEALRSLPTATGSVQDNQSTNSFTPGASTISLLGLDPSFTLVLMNGRPLADYPFLYNSSSNFVDLNTIPNFMVDHIDIVPGNQSAIYGSAAIAGVINIVLKQKIDGMNIDARVGGYTEGGGSQQRVQIGGGHSWGALDGMFAVEFNNQQPIFGYQRSYTDSNLDNPVASGRVAERDRAFFDAFVPGQYDDPGQATCDAISSLDKGRVTYANRPGHGFYCGSLYNVGNTTFLNRNKAVNGYGSLKYELNDNVQLYTDLLYDYTKTNYRVGGTAFWTTGDGVPTYVYDLDDSVLVQPQHIYLPEELGNLMDGRVTERSYVFNLGARGTFGGSNWNYDASYHRSQYNADATERLPLTDAVNNFFLGPQSGTDPYGYGYPAYHIRQNGHFWGAVTPAQYLTYSAIDRSDSETYTQQGNVTITNTDLFSLPAGSVGFAGVAELGNQKWDNPIDPRVTAGEFWGRGGTSGEGTRDRQAIGGELNIPIFSMLTGDASARYDRYSAAGNSQGKITYKVGLEFRPIDTLLFRGNYGTGFRAPDMGYVFSNGSSAFTTVQDTYNCRKTQGDQFGSCNPPFDSVQIKSFTNGNRDLKYITAKSFGYGIVYSPLSTLNMKADFYHVSIGNEVASYSLQTILDKEADCLLGHTASGVAVDQTSATCQQFISQVGRNPLTAPIGAGLLNTVTTYPINIANEVVAGVTSSAQYRLEAGRIGDFTFGADFNTTFKHQTQQFPDDPVTDLLRENQYYDQFKDIVSGSVNWKIGSWSTTLFGIRYGKTWSYDGSYTVAPWIVYNATLQYNINDDAALTLISNNVFNKRPPQDRSFSAYPYYNIYNYNSYGRFVALEFNMHFGAGSK